MKAPTLVTHCTGDVRVPFALGQEIAAGIPGAKFIPLESRNHIFLADEPATRIFFDAVPSFLGDRPFRGALPGTATFKDRAQRRIAALERNWLIKPVRFWPHLQAPLSHFCSFCACCGSERSAGLHRRGRIHCAFMAASLMTPCRPQDREIGDGQISSGDCAARPAPIALFPRWPLVSPSGCLPCLKGFFVNGRRTPVFYMKAPFGLPLLTISRQ